MQVFNFDPTTGRYLGVSLADPDPMQPGEFLIPAHATATPPPATMAGQVAVFDAEADAWDVEALPTDATPPAGGAQEANPSLAAVALRNRLLAASDVAVLRAYERGEPVPAALVEYRQALRDLPAQKDFPHNINWPQAPAA